ncbi:MAG: ATP synthase subunit C [Candidatus Thorarchaeota archaeon]
MRLDERLLKKTILILCAISVVVIAADTASAQTTDPPDMKPIGAGLAVGLAGLGSSIGMGMAGSAAIGAITEKPEVFGKAFLFIVLIEAVAIYGLLVAILLIL